MKKSPLSIPLIQGNKKTIPKLVSGFTLIELLVVIAIIGVLSSVVLASLNTARKKARDTIRMADMKTIYTMLVQYQMEYGGIPITNSYSDANSGGWDYSSQPVGNPTFMNFLVTGGITSKVPVDPINNMAGDSSPAGTFGYKYYCYSGSGLALGYIQESTGYTIYYPKYQDTNFTCL
jgi:prepilin-type N-terminal cleavage/methylation domain-containing protein